MIDPVRTVAPVGYPVTLEEAKAHLRVTHTAEDGLITGLIAAATDYLDLPNGILGRAILPQTWREEWDDFNGDLRLRVGPVASLVTLTYTDAAGAPQSVTGARIVTSAGFSRLFPALGESWPSGTAVVAVYTAGSAEVPYPLKAAILLHVGALYANREAVSEKAQTPVPLAYDALITPYRRFLV